MYKVYKVIRTDSVSYDEFDKCVVIAKDEEEAFEVATNNYYVFTRDKVDIVEVKLDSTKAVLGSFCAG